MKSGYFLVAGLFFVLAACGPSDAPVSPADQGVAASDAGPEARQDQGKPPVPKLRFLDSNQKEVTSIYLQDPVSVQVSGLVPKKMVTVVAEMPPWKSDATFVVAADGTVDTSRDAPVKGTYSGVDADGLFWSMNTSAFKYADTPDVTFTVSEGGKPFLDGRLTRTATVAGMKMFKPQDTTLVGTLFVPPGGGPSPGILAFGGSEGGQFGGEEYAFDLVPQGYAVFGIAYFGAAGLPATLKEIPLEYFDKAIEWMKARPEIDPARLGVIGGSRGGELSLLLAARIPGLKAAVADAPSGYVWGAAAADGAGWTDKGKPLPWVPWQGSLGTPVTMPSGGTAIAYTPMFLDDIAKSTPAELDAARIRVENAGAAIAMFGGKDDQLWPSCQLAQVAMDRLVASGHATSHGDELACFADAGHLLTVVGLPTTWSSFTKGTGTQYMALGGTPAGIAHAGRRRQIQLQKFLERTLKR